MKFIKQEILFRREELGEREKGREDFLFYPSDTYLVVSCSS